MRKLIRTACRRSGASLLEKRTFVRSRWTSNYAPVRFAASLSPGNQPQMEGQLRLRGRETPLFAVLFTGSAALPGGCGSFAGSRRALSRSASLSVVGRRCFFRRSAKASLARSSKTLFTVARKPLEREPSLVIEPDPLPLHRHFFGSVWPFLPAEAIPQAPPWGRWGTQATDR